jgi:WD40 repeat protein
MRRRPKLSGEDSSMRTWTAHKKNVTALAFSPDGNLLASVGVDRGLRVWDSATGKRQWQVEYPAESARMITVAFSPDGEFLAVGAEGAVEVHEVASGERVAQLRPEDPREGPGVVDGLVFHPKQKLLAACSAGSEALSYEVLLWKWPGWKAQKPPTRSGEVGIWKFVFSPKGDRFASIDFWHVSISTFPKIKIEQEFPHGGGGAATLTWSPDGKRLLFSFDTLLLTADADAGWDEDFADQLNDSEAGEIEDEFLEENGVAFIRAKKDLQAVVFTPDGQFLLTACGDKNVRFWEGDTLEAVQGFDWKDR